MPHKNKAPYGTWQSPITPDLVAKSANYLTELRVVADHIYWIERRPQEAGRQQLMRLASAHVAEPVTPSDQNVGNCVHEYGGGSYVVSGEWIYFANGSDQRWYRQKTTANAVPITPAPPSSKAWRYADAVVTPDGQWLIAVRERHEADGVHNDLVAIATDASFTIKVLASGEDFYAAPRLSVSGKYIAWLSWHHPQMPWDGTALWYGELSDTMTIHQQRQIAGSDNESICQPSWSPDEKLYFCSDVTNWWNIYYYDHETVNPVCRLSAEFGYAQWIFGTQTYAFIDAHTLVAVITDQGQQRLGFIQNQQWTAFDLPYDAIAPYVAIQNQQVIFIGANAENFPAIIRYDWHNKRIEKLIASSALTIDKKYLSLPQMLTFVSDQHQAHAFYYPPFNADYAAPQNEKPPLIVQSHGGPTSASSTELNLKIQYWTSRGFSVLDVNYGGSTGYGRAYRELLKGQWGIVDVRDCVNAAKALVSEEKADPKRLIIRGSSASGFTVLCALAFNNLFALGASYYGVADLENLIHDTHKFESHYLEKLIGPYPQQKVLYEQRSPLLHADQLHCPMIFFQGLADKVVPPTQTESMINALQKNKIPYAYVTFPQEQHGFRDAKTTKAALEAELYFYSYFLKIKPADVLKDIPIYRP
jgi:dipeptidyl aminopeptidase/acylaminoacyl peptidase